MHPPRPRGRPKAFNDKTDQNTIQSLDRAMVILRAVSEHDGLSLTDLSIHTDQAAATVYRVLTTLQSHGIVETEGDSQLWHVGSGAFRIGTKFLRRTKLAERSREPMQELMRQTGETANLGVEKQDEVLFLSQVETHQTIRAFFPPGTQSPMHASGIGKALLAFYTPDQVSRVVQTRGLAGFTTLTITSEALLTDDLARTRLRGYSIDDQERADGMRCIAAPIFDAYGAPVAGVSVSGPSFRIPLSSADHIGRMVRGAAEAITTAIGGTSPTA